MSNDFPPGPEKRKYRRAAVELPVKLEINGQEIQTTTENISCGGMFLPVPAAQGQLKEDAPLTAFITLPDGSKVVQMPAKICRVNRGVEGHVDGFAVKFGELFDDNHVEIDRYIKWKLLN